ncbi:hypothetical protein [Desulfitibacter alkalitolerans]|nr:hypothetical protein [Desulfitibacter alkalitolerans]
MVQGFNGKNTSRKRRNPYWLSARGINLGALSQKSYSLLDDDDEIPKRS